MIETDYARKLDSMGRITIPTKLREELGFEIGNIYHYHLLEDGTKKYLCIECPDTEQTKIKNAKQLLEEAGFTVS